MSLRFLVVEGNTSAVREKYRLDLGATPAEHYGAVLLGLAGAATFDILCPADAAAALPHNAALTDYDGVVLTGSALNLWKGEPESRRQVELAREIYRANVPFFGSCWGIQIAAAAAGGEVRPNPRGREMGFARAIAKSEAGAGHALLAGRPAIFDAPCSHLDEVTTLPPNATLLASNAVSAVQAAEFRFEGGTFWGVQYHPEFSPGIIAYLTEAMGDQLVAEGFFADRAQGDQYAADLRQLEDDEPPRHIAYRLGLGADLTDPARRMVEISNFIAHRVRRHRAARASPVLRSRARLRRAFVTNLPDPWGERVLRADVHREGNMRQTIQQFRPADQPRIPGDRHGTTAHRRVKLLAFLAAAAGLAPAMIAPLGAATIETESKIDQVIVYPDGALVRRSFSVDLPAGSHEIVIANLPPSIDQASLRVEGSAEGRVSIGAVDFRLSPVVQPPSQNTAKLRALRAEHDVVSDRIDALDGKRSMIRRLASSAGEGKDTRPLDLADWTKAWDAVGGALQQVNAELRTQRIELARIEEEIRALAAADGPQRPLPPRRIAVIAVDAATAGKASLALSYRVSGASWRPVYDARLATGSAKPALDLVQRAMLRQHTGEDWPEASFTLSTLRVAGGTASPELYGERIAFYEPRPVPMPRAQMAPSAPMPSRAPGDLARQDEERARVAAVAPPAPIEESQATLETTAFQSEFQLPERFSLPSGNQEKSVRLGVLPAEATLSHRTSPALDTKAYLEASFEVKGETPLLAGEVLLTRDGSFIGKGRISQTAPGETLRLGFGADDRVAVKRVPVGRRARDPGILGSTRQEDLRFRIDVKNLHAFAIDLTVLDRIPVSEDREITVERLPDMTKPDAETIEDRRGTFAWKPTLKPGEAKSFTTAYRLRWPAGREVRLQPLR